jgi:hypothetical protein
LGSVATSELLQAVLLKRLGVFPSRFLLRFQWQKKTAASMEGSPYAQTPASSWCAAKSYVREAGKPMKAVELAVSRKGCLLKNPGYTQ